MEQFWNDTTKGSKMGREREMSLVNWMHEQENGRRKARDDGMR